MSKNKMNSWNSPAQQLQKVLMLAHLHQIHSTAVKTPQIVRCGDLVLKSSTLKSIEKLHIEVDPSHPPGESNVSYTCIHKGRTYPVREHPHPHCKAMKRKFGLQRS